MVYHRENNHFRIKDLPDDQRPREKVVSHGVHTLSNGELLAILIGTGNRKRNAVLLGNDLLTKYESLFELSRKNWKTLSRLDGIGTAKAVRLEAAFEIARRINSFQTGKRDKIENPQDVFNLYRHRVAHLSQEVLQVLLLNSRNEIIQCKEVTRGLVNSTSAHPREIFKHAIDYLAVGIILIHNHPSQNTSPSSADRVLTKRVFEAGKIIDIPLLDHIIITQDDFFSFKDEGII